MKYTVPDEAIHILLDRLTGLADAMPDNYASGIRRQIGVFRAQHLSPKSGERKSVARPHFFILKEAHTGELYVLSEFNPSDGGRCHVLGPNTYGVFDRTTLTLDFNKAVIDIGAVLHEFHNLPEGVAPERNSILRHYGYQTE